MISEPVFRLLFSKKKYNKIEAEISRLDFWTDPVLTLGSSLYVILPQYQIKVVAKPQYN